MMRTPRPNRLACRTALAALLSVAAAALTGCSTETPLSNGNTNAGDLARSEAADRGNQSDWERRSKDPAINPETYFASGQLAETQELWPRAFAQYNKALKLNHDHLPSLFRLGVLYAKFKQYPEAVATWTHYLKATGGDSTGYANLGFCQELAGRFDLAENAYEAGIRHDPNNAPCRVNYGLMLARRGRFNQAMREWQVVLSDAEVHYNLGSAYQSLDRREQAKLEFRKALELDPQLTEARARLAALGEGVDSPTAAPMVPTIAETGTPTTAPAVAAAPTTAPQATAAVTPETPESPQTPESPEVMTIEVTGPTTAPTTGPVAAGGSSTTAPTASTADPEDANRSTDPETLPPQPD